MFQETLPEGTEYPTTQFTTEPTAMEYLAEPAQLLTKGVHELAQFQNDAGTTVSMIPDLVQLLQDEDPEIVSNTARFLHQLSKDDANRQALMADAQVVTALIQTVHAGAGKDNEEIANSAVKILYQLSGIGSGHEVVVRSFGIPFLIKLLGYQYGPLVRYAVTILHNMIVMEHFPQAKTEVFRHGGVQAMVPLLDIADGKFVSVVCDCLKHLTIGNQEAKVIILAEKGPVRLLRVINTNAYEKLINAALSVLKAISVDEQNKKSILQNNGVAILVNLAYRCLEWRSSRVLLTSILYLLRNLSDMLISDRDFHEMDLRPLLKLVVPLLEYRSPWNSDLLDPLVLCSVGILSNLTCNSELNKSVVCQLGGIGRLLNVCQCFPKKEEVTEPALCTLRHITNRHDQSAYAKVQVRERGGLRLINAMLKQPNIQWTLIKAIVSLLQNLASAESNRDEIRDLGIMKLVVDYFQSAVHILQEYQASRCNLPLTNVVIQNMRMHEMLECIIGTLSQMAKDPKSRLYIRSQEFVIPTLVQLLAFPAKNVIRSASDLLAELSADPEGAAAIAHQPGAVETLIAMAQRCRHNPNNQSAVGAIATTTLYRIREAQDPEFHGKLQKTLSEVVSYYGSVVSNESAVDYDNLLTDSYHRCHSTGPPSVHGSVYGTDLSVYDPETMSGMVLRSL
ncbi:armadillo segment polarity protein-like [Paramacrobiotus metropolitanus]|uniref:armadillo segment polarity protein-like n=1 Tax=Paramacrobiotus metropolitanus TaxID=2943436 RepID=UPI002445C320|nr:armadillo segment polarity protein-like [Paramacrobiotus metropolitanus]XP_055353644.1 armadillo segment polarity protein-like [Paramacrobiotus metropolitanus]